MHQIVSMSQKPPLCNMEQDGQPNYTWLIDSSPSSANRSGVSVSLLLTKPKWCRTNLTSLLTGSLSSSSLSCSHIFSPTLFKCSRGHESYSLVRIHTIWLTNQRPDQPATPLSAPASFLHSSTHTHSVLHNFLWFRLLVIEANVSSVWFNGSFCFCVLNFLLYFNLGNRRVRLVALWVHFKIFYLLSVFIF